jgi:L-histidine Nalpha-methyltransferase
MAEPRSASSPRFALLNDTRPKEDFAHDVRAGLTTRPKSLPPRWFYDVIGSSLFDTICFLPEYYVTRSEVEILTNARREIVGAIGENIRLVELGSGTARKTRILLDVLTVHQQDLEYVPVDVDAAMLERTGAELLAAYRRMRVTAICSDFSRPSIPLSLLSPHAGRTVVLFLGSTIGNLDPDAARAMLADLRGSLTSGDALFLGVDLRKDASILEPAYDDALGVTAAFNRNVLGRINRELGGHFPIETFRHRAFYDSDAGRVEMHLVSDRAQRVRIDALDLEIDFSDGESIHTESSYKYDTRGLQTLAAGSGFELGTSWTDSRGWFADVLMIAR